jgi:hypothetical protein
VAPRFTDLDLLSILAVWFLLPALSLALVVVSVFANRARLLFRLLLGSTVCILVWATVWSLMNSAPAGFCTTYVTIWTIPIAWLAVALSGVLVLLRTLRAHH